MNQVTINENNPPCARCGKERDSHYIDYVTMEKHGWALTVMMRYPGLCKWGEREHFGAMTPMELCVWIEAQYEKELS